MAQLRDLHRGDSKIWRINSDVDITGCAFQVIIAHTDSEGNPQYLVSNFNLDVPSEDGLIYGTSLELTPEQTNTLTEGTADVYVIFTSTLGRVKTLGEHKMLIKPNRHATGG